ncbi:hypothetical protein KY290_036866 [Solanum tuberosum]|uniref:Uncharacterized protein n=1 Tax=Solanum tuberosum TaxID=4113 RepID=A0ABQ7TTX3_SOLTU|nr:hypothetical protein KY289_037912 [Solanum tuberosum]KAH0639603.1 hypothetical protein KY285_036189 [Solanum tuberosum]KAH0738161.1 hypothetical protein KY290_036866 [Solanum tuberosum]
MADNVNHVEEQIQENTLGDEIFYHEWFVFANFHRLYDHFLTKNIIKERDMLLDNLEECMPGLYGRLEASGWLCFKAEPIKAYYSWVHKFYANATENNFETYFVVIV